MCTGDGTSFAHCTAQGADHAHATHSRDVSHHVLATHVAVAASACFGGRLYHRVQMMKHPHFAPLVNVSTFHIPAPVSPAGAVMQQASAHVHLHQTELEWSPKEGLLRLDADDCRAEHIFTGPFAHRLEVNHRLCRGHVQLHLAARHEFAVPLAECVGYVHLCGGVQCAESGANIHAQTITVHHDRSFKLIFSISALSLPPGKPVTTYVKHSGPRLARRTLQRRAARAGRGKIRCGCVSQ